MAWNATRRAPGPYPDMVPIGTPGGPVIRGAAPYSLAAVSLVSLAPWVTDVQHHSPLTEGLPLKPASGPPPLTHLSEEALTRL